ncbi:MAG: response regulator transcription factor [Anaerolineae bacterium]
MRPATDQRLEHRRNNGVPAPHRDWMRQNPEDRARLLVVDDEFQIRNSLVRALTLKGYQVDPASSGRQALAMLADRPYDLMVLDLSMPGLNGVEVMRRARQMHPNLLIIILTGNASLESAIVAVKTHAVDYLCKPTSVHDIAEAVADALRRCAERLNKQRLLRVMGQAMDGLRQIDSPGAKPAPSVEGAGRYVRFWTLTLDRHKRTVVISGTPEKVVELTSIETGILAHLLERPDEVFTCQQLAKVVWGFDLDKSEAQNLVRPHIFRLRQKIESKPNNPAFIRTVRGRGYLFALPD